MSWPNRRAAIPLLWIAVAATALGCGAFAGLRADPQDGLPTPAQVSAFRRPAKPDPAAVARDPVWRLGARLFQDPRLSRSGRTSCATCHDPNHSWTDTQPLAIGDAGRKLAFRSPTLLGSGALDRHGWTGRFPDTESVITFALTSPGNMNKPLDESARLIDGSGDYGASWSAAFNHSKADPHELCRALAVYVGSITAAPAPFDRWIAGDRQAIPAAAKRGFALFTGKAKCAACHSGWTFTDGSFHDIGAAVDDKGRGVLFPSSIKLQYAFKTPTLRNVSVRAPYMHDGSKATLRDVVELYDRGGLNRPSRADDIVPLHLSAAEKDDLISFLETLTSETAYTPAL